MLTFFASWEGSEKDRCSDGWRLWAHTGPWGHAVPLAGAPRVGSWEALALSTGQAFRQLFRGSAPRRVPTGWELTPPMVGTGPGLGRPPQAAQCTPLARTSSLICCHRGPGT